MQLPILVAVADRATRELIVDLLSQKGHNVTDATDVKQALGALEGDTFSIVVTDVDEELDLIRRSKSHNADGVVIAVTDRDDSETTSKILQLGAYDLLITPLANMDLVAALLNRAIQQAELRRDNGHLLDSLKRNVDEMGKLNNALRELAARDGLTGLYNHRFFGTRMNRPSAEGSADSCQLLADCYPMEVSCPQRQQSH